MEFSEHVRRICMYTCVYMYTCIYIYICIYTCVYIYICTTIHPLPKLSDVEREEPFAVRQVIFRQNDPGGGGGRGGNGAEVHVSQYVASQRSRHRRFLRALRFEGNHLCVKNQAASNLKPIVEGPVPSLNAYPFGCVLNQGPSCDDVSQRANLFLSRWVVHM